MDWKCLSAFWASGAMLETETSRQNPAGREIQRRDENPKDPGEGNHRDKKRYSSKHNASDKTNIAVKARKQHAKQYRWQHHAIIASTKDRTGRFLDHGEKGPKLE